MSESVGIDDVLTPPEAAAWLKLPLRELQAKTRSGNIPAIRRLGKKTLRYHVRTVLKRLGAETPEVQKFVVRSPSEI